MAVSALSKVEVKMRLQVVTKLLSIITLYSLCSIMLHRNCYLFYLFIL